MLALLVEPREFLFQSLCLVLQAIALGTGGGDGPLQLGFLAMQAVDPFRGRLQFLLRLPEPPLGFLLLGQRRVAALLGLALLRPGAAFGLGGGTAALLGFAALAFGGFPLVVETGQRGFGIPDGAGEAIAPAAGGFQFGAVVGDLLTQLPGFLAQAGRGGLPGFGLGAQARQIAGECLAVAAQLGEFPFEAAAFGTERAERIEVPDALRLPVAALARVADHAEQHAAEAAERERAGQSECQLHARPGRRRGRRGDGLMARPVGCRR